MELPLRARYSLCLALLFCAAPAWSQTIVDVVNYGSRIGTGLPGAGIAQGALFAITGPGVGPAQPVQATFPLPTTDGLGGVSVSLVASDGSTVNAIMVYAAPNEVDAILPSSTTLGSATLTLNNNGASATSTINVVASAFGIFNAAGAYNVNSDGTTTLNTNYRSAQPGQTVLISGTGLGAIPSDETQSGVMDVPAGTITVWVGAQQAAVASAGRGTCCTGIDPNFPIPQGVAAWDVLAIVIPDHTSGCLVAVAVQTPNGVSNLVNISVAPGGGTCFEALQTNGGTPTLVSGQIKVGLVTMLRGVTNINVGIQSVTNISDSATATFTSVDYGSNQVPVPPYAPTLQASVGSCTASVTRFDRSIILPTQPAGTPPPILDAGPALTISNAKGTESMPFKKGIYSANTSITTVPLPVGPPVTTGGPDFIQPGSYTLDNGGGGADIGAFVATLSNPTPVNWTSMAQNATITLSQGATVTWTGGDANGVVAITGFSSAIQDPVILAGSFTCFANAADGQFTVPSFVTQMLPPSGATIGSGNLTVIAFSASVVQIPGVDVTYYVSQASQGATAVYQ